MVLEGACDLREANSEDCSIFLDSKEDLSDLDDFFRVTWADDFEGFDGDD